MRAAACRPTLGCKAQPRLGPSRGSGRACPPANAALACKPVHTRPLTQPHPPDRGPQATPRRVEQWVRLRLRQAGLPRPDAVFAVSALNGYGVREMLARLRDGMGFRADLWVVGAQNGGAGRGLRKPGRSRGRARRLARRGGADVAVALARLAAAREPHAAAGSGLFVTLTATTPSPRARASQRPARAQRARAP
jgi:hypothetical protein